MRYSFAPVAFAALAAAMPQGVTDNIAPSETPAADCKATYPGTFQIQIVNVTSPAKRDVLELTLNDGVLKDNQLRTGYIAANNQLQFDGPDNGPVQTGAIYTAGFSVCSNGSLALGDSSLWYACLSGTFYNLYDENTAAQCDQVYIEVINASGGSPTQAVSQIPDGQVTGKPVSQISDGQIQASTGAPVTQIGDGQIQAPTGAPVTQIGDGQIQAPTGKPVTQISDGQIQAPTGAPVTQIGDGQIQAPTGKPVTQISDGQIQAPTGAPVTQIGDGQIQAPTGSVPRPSNGTVPKPSASPSPYTGAASSVRGELFGLAAIMLGGLAML